MLERRFRPRCLVAPFQFRCTPLAADGRRPCARRDESGAGGVNRATAPLRGVRIADFTIHAAGPFGTQLLAQLGAECIKIESKARPDAFRKPHAVYGRMSAATFDQVSVNKLSVRLNLKQPEAVRAGQAAGVDLGRDRRELSRGGDEASWPRLRRAACGQAGRHLVVAFLLWPERPGLALCRLCASIRRLGRTRVDDGIR